MGVADREGGGEGAAARSNVLLDGVDGREVVIPSGEHTKLSENAEELFIVLIENH
jgi:hypothetical protein